MTPDEPMPRLTPFLWFDALLSEPIAYYRSIFDDRQVGFQSRVAGSCGGRRVNTDIGEARPT
jgi:predicted 3-demethylubiquinone-9 3-methyltransferase (glyoxalase superfamily)